MARLSSLSSDMPTTDGSNDVQSEFADKMDIQHSTGKLSALYVSQMLLEVINHVKPLGFP